MASSSSSSSSSESSDPNPNPHPPIKTLTPQKCSEPEDSSEENEEEEETVEIQPPQKPLEPKDSSEEEEQEEEQEQEQEEEQVEKSPENSQKKKSAIQRIWTLEDEMTLLWALSDYQLKNGKLPPSKDYASFISTISGSISFPVTVKQLFNKMRTMKFNYNQNKKKGSNIKFSTPHDKVVFDLCTKLYEDGSNGSKQGASQETNRDDAETKRDSKRKKGSSHFYLEGLIKDMISTEKCLRWFSTVEEVVEHIGESGAHDLEAKTKMLRMDAIKLHAREENLIAELFEILADEMVDD
ncbi:hypothetical protein FCM35_KLT06442 [Carex littledalei]|uniref:Glabrous enhancer-binding protein-like DBD domain-containing protein n=1 Tax=Carex littledalei TaxID=544730 RepID=A0A833V7S5_9POAL|nr:hypothetical protein FCM35_KLT06442 [Carex littledalei]